MSYLVLARKCRPQTFEQVIKQNHVTQTLTNAISSGRVAHAILFSGPRGTGKTTVARILAKSMNCKEGPATVPCNVCKSCREITLSSAVDVFEIDGASNNSVDQIRALRENIRYMPAGSRYKIYIIDEVHMLSISAFNALLKTLEEPPSHVMFIFATTEPRKIPITILSRCQRYDFRRIDIESISKYLETICAREGVDLAVSSLQLIAREAGGSIRDALSLLDQVMTCAEETITNDHVLDILGVIDRKVIFDISGAVLRKDILELLDILDEVYDRGHEMKQLYTYLVEHFRNLLVIRMGKRISKLVDLPAHEIDMMLDQVKGVSAAFLNQILDLLLKEESAIRFSTQPKLTLEMAFIKIFQIKPALPIDLLIEKLDNLRKGVYEKEEEETDICKKLEEPSVVTTFDSDGSLAKTWEKLLDIFSEKHPLLAANLTRCTLKRLTDKDIEIEVNGNGFNINMVRRDKNVAIIKRVCSDFFGKRMDLTIKVKKIQQDDKDQQKRGENSRLKQEVLNHSLVADAIEIFGGKVIDVKIL